MKKIIALSMLAATLAATSSFGQGYMTMSSGRSQVWNGTGAAATVNSSSLSVMLYWAASGAANPFAALTGLGNTPTSANNTTTENWTATQAWAALAAAGSWTQGVLDDSSGNPLTGANANGVASTTRGVVAYDGGGTFGIAGTSPGTSYALLLVSYVTGSFGSGAIGWSYVTPTVSALGSAPPATGQPDESGAFANFGTFVPVLSVVPEPTSIALASLGGLSLLMLRRKK